MRHSGAKKRLLVFRRPALILAFITGLSCPLLGQAGDFDTVRVAQGVHVVVRRDPPGLMVDANNVLIINDQDVVVVDSNGAPSITREVLAVLRKITDKPVRYVVNTHYHDDHIRGNQVYRDAFPRVEFIAHPFARDYLPGQGAVNRKNFVGGATSFLVQLRALLKEGKSLLGGEMTEEERQSLSRDIGLADLVLKEADSAETILPTIAVEDCLTLRRGSRVIEILHLGGGHTAADLVVHLPQEGILIAGDLVVWPVPLVGDPQSHLQGWSNALQKIRALQPRIIIPGHGPILRDDKYLVQLENLFAAITQQTAAAVARGETLEQVRQSVNLQEFRKQFAGKSRVRTLLFNNYVAGPAVAVAFREAGGAP